MKLGEAESASKLALVALVVVALFLVIASGDWGAGNGFPVTERSTATYGDFARDLFDHHGFELVVAALIIAAAALGGLQIAREEEYD